MNTLDFIDPKTGVCMGVSLTNLTAGATVHVPILTVVGVISGGIVIVERLFGMFLKYKDYKRNKKNDRPNS